MRKQKKKVLSIMLLGMALFVCGCGAAGTDGAADSGTGAEPSSVSIEQSSEQQNAETESPAIGEADGNADYYFVANGVTIQVDADMDELLAELGESKSVFEAPSCAGEGVSYLYNYTSFEIETYPAEGGKNLIGYIIFKDDMVATTEGVDLSMSKEDVLRVYGEDYVEDGNKLTYEKGGTKLNFIFEGDDIASIEYVSAVIG